MDELTIDSLRRLMGNIRAGAIHPWIGTGIVTNEAEAQRMTEEDPTGRVWKVGDEYYRVQPKCQG